MSWSYVIGGMDIFCQRSRLVYASQERIIVPVVVTINPVHPVRVARRNPSISRSDQYISVNSTERIADTEKAILWL